MGKHVITQGICCTASKGNRIRWTGNFISHQLFLGMDRLITSFSETLSVAAHRHSRQYNESLQTLKDILALTINELPGNSIYFFIFLRGVQCLVAQLCPTLCDPMDCSPPGSSVHGDSPVRNTGVDCNDLFHGIFPTQGSNPGLLCCRQILYHLVHQGSPL